MPTKEAAQQAQADIASAIMSEQRRQQARQEQLVTAAVTERLLQAWNEHQAELSALSADHEQELSTAHAEHAAQLQVAETKLQQSREALTEVPLLLPPASLPGLTAILDRTVCADCDILFASRDV